ncbi:MAG: hypothetical protein GY749_38835 [Desulfobacteraceae bacterium]|nr:hypothetical protein [Desulfobacteraceae bacterium]
MSNISFSHKINPLWDSVKMIREEVESSLKMYKEELAEASKMTASELIENAVKHGSSPDNGSGIQFEFSANSSRIKMEIINKINSEEDYEVLKDNIDQIRSSDNPEELYISRLCELMEDTKLNKSRLGLFRIAYEGEFKLNYTFENNIVTVVAVRDIS